MTDRIWRIFALLILACVSLSSAWLPNGVTRDDLRKTDRKEIRGIYPQRQDKGLLGHNFLVGVRGGFDFREDRAESPAVDVGLLGIAGGVTLGYRRHFRPETGLRLSADFRFEGATLMYSDLVPYRDSRGSEGEVSLWSAHPQASAILHVLPWPWVALEPGLGYAFGYYRPRKLREKRWGSSDVDFRLTSRHREGEILLIVSTFIGGHDEFNVGGGVVTLWDEYYRNYQGLEILGRFSFAFRPGMFRAD